MEKSLRRQFIEYLETLPDDTEIEVLEMHDGGYGGSYGRWVSLNLDQYDGNIELLDMRDNPFAVNDNSVLLRLGRD
jgi:hypothetical protein